MKRIWPALGDDLTQQELAVLRLVANGNTNHLTGRALGLTSNVVAERLRSARIKLGAHDRTHTVTLALRARLIDLDGVRAQGEAA